MDPKKLNSYVGVVNQPPPKWSSVKKWLLHINYAPGYAPEPEQKPVCRQFSRCEGCPYRRDGDCPGWEATIKTFEELYDAADWAGIEYIYIYDTNGQWLYLPTGNQEAVLRSLKEDLENDTVQYSEPPDLEDLLGEDWDEEQEDGPSIEM